MISDTIFDSTQRILQELAWYTVTQDYTDDQIQEVINSLAKYAAIGTDFDAGGDGIVSDVGIEAHIVDVTQDRLTERFFECLKEQQKWPDEPIFTKEERERRIGWAKDIHNKLDGYHDMPNMHVPFNDEQKAEILERLNALRDCTNDIVKRLKPSDDRTKYFDFVMNVMTPPDPTNAVWILDNLAELLEDCRTDNEDEMSDLALMFAVETVRQLRVLVLWNKGGIVRDDCWLN